MTNRVIRSKHFNEEIPSCQQFLKGLKFTQKTITLSVLTTHDSAKAGALFEVAIEPGKPVSAGVKFRMMAPSEPPPRRGKNSHPQIKKLVCGWEFFRIHCKN